MESFNEHFGKEAGTNPVQVKTGKKGKVLIAIVIIVLVALIAAVAYLGWNWLEMRKQFQKMTMPAGIQELQKKQNQEILDKIAKHIVLPSGEEPIIATVTDAAALKKESDFYQSAKNNDIVIIYTKAKKAYLYDPDRDIILNVGPVITEESTSPVSESATPTSSATRTPRAS